MEQFKDEVRKMAARLNIEIPAEITIEFSTRVMREAGDRVVHLEVRNILI